MAISTALFSSSAHLWSALSLNSFIQQGGPVIPALFVLAFVLWFLIIERFLFLRFEYPRFYSQQIALWLQRSNKRSWASQRVRELMISEADIKLQRFLSTIKVLIAICPLMGLLGTVTGMVQVFDTIALTGNSDAKAMAGGIYQATLPTMAGLTLALTALYFNHHLQQKVRFFTAQIKDHLTATDAAPMAEVSS